MSWGANTVAQFEQTDRKGSNFLVTLRNPEYEAFVQNMFKLVRWASGVVRRQRFVKRICPCDTDEMRVSRRSMGLSKTTLARVLSILKLLVNSGNKKLLVIAIQKRAQKCCTHNGFKKPTSWTWLQTSTTRYIIIHTPT
jgi:hypothetical protein